MKKTGFILLVCMGVSSLLAEDSQPVAAAAAGASLAPGQAVSGQDLAPRGARSAGVFAPGKAGGPNRADRRRARARYNVLESLTEAEQAQYTAAFRKAQEDPAVKAARVKVAAAHKARQEVLKADPALAALREKLKNAPQSVTPEEREQLRAAYGGPMPERQELEAEIEAALRRADPGVGAVLDKIEAERVARMEEAKKRRGAPGQRPPRNPGQPGQTGAPGH